MKEVYEGNLIPLDEMPNNEDKSATEEDTGKGEPTTPDGNDEAKEK